MNIKEILSYIQLFCAVVCITVGVGAIIFTIMMIAADYITDTITTPQQLAAAISEEKQKLNLGKEIAITASFSPYASTTACSFTGAPYDGATAYRIGDDTYFEVSICLQRTSVVRHELYHVYLVRRRHARIIGHTRYIFEEILALWYGATRINPLSLCATCLD